MGEVILSLFISCIIPFLLIILGAVLTPYVIVGLTFEGSLINAFIVLITLGFVAMILGKYQV